MEITVILSQENETLPKAELLARLETLDIEYEITSEYPGVITFTTPASEDDIIELGSHLGYTHEILQTIKRTTPEELNNAVKDVDWSEYVNSSFKVRVKRMGNGDVDKDSIERYIGGYIKQQSQMPVDLTNADCTIKLVYTNPKLEVNEFKESKVVGYNEVIITRQIIEQDKKHFFDNKPHKRPYFHPGSMSPKLALCMVNLARTHKGDTVLDPFCGIAPVQRACFKAHRKFLCCDIDQHSVDIANRLFKEELQCKTQPLKSISHSETNQSPSTKSLKRHTKFRSTAQTIR